MTFRIDAGWISMLWRREHGDGGLVAAIPLHLKAGRSQRRDDQPAVASPLHMQRMPERVSGRPAAEIACAESSVTVERVIIALDVPEHGPRHIIGYFVPTAA
jgi:hypothetical protein